jgi:hypothetical protein
MFLILYIKDHVFGGPVRVQLIYNTPANSADVMHFVPATSKWGVTAGVEVEDGKGVPCT